MPSRKTLFSLFVIALSTMSPFAYSDEELSTAMLGSFNKLITTFATVEETDAQRAIVSTVVDFAAITRGVMHKHRAAMSDEQQVQFQTQFERSLTTLLATALAGSQDYTVAIERVRMSEKSPNRAQILGILTTAKNERFELLTVAGKNSRGWLVRNLTINGINLGITYRNQFNELVLKHAGDFDAAIAAWTTSIKESNS
ncbi:MAG: hypothetical protein GKR90_01295 [Pseudomonadales bacterium]|nr:hypothetical protein [Pseudomonadales bacterium]